MWGQQRRLDADGSEGTLAALAGGPLDNLFCAWRGASEQRYIASIYPIDPAADDAGLPVFEGCVLIAVTRSGGRRKVLSVDVLERASGRPRAIARGRAFGADEWHVHFLADSPRGRSAAAADLARRHLAADRIDHA